MFHTYILYSESIEQYYTGYTSVGIKKRLRRNNKGDSPSTKSGIPWQVRYVKSFETKTEAIKWENFIKRQKSRKFIEQLIAPEEMNKKYYSFTCAPSSTTRLDGRSK